MAQRLTVFRWPKASESMLKSARYRRFLKWWEIKGQVIFYAGLITLIAAYFMWRYMF